MGKKEPTERRRYVDMWALPGMHPSNVEFMQKLKTADTNHFTTHMDVVGTVSEQDIESGDWNPSHLIGLRTDVWRADKQEMEDALDVMQDQRRQELKKQIKKTGRLNNEQEQLLESQLQHDDVMKLQSSEIEKRRLVLKLFKTDTERVRWCGTIEQVTTTEIHNSIGSKRSLLTMVVMLPRVDMVTYIQQNHRTFRIPSIFTFGFYNDQRMWNLTFKRRWFSIGADFDVEADGKTMGELDGRLFSFGSDSYIDLEPHELNDNTRFVDLVTLFTASVGYHKAMRRSVDRRVKAALDGKSRCHLIEDEELRLRHNGRAAA
ncbi:MAG: hypothetical protein ACR2NZ_07655 [Rubripirellula sp.]